MELSYRKSGEEILPDNEEVVISPEAVKESIHDLKKEESFTNGEENAENTKKKRDKKKCQFLLQQFYTLPSTRECF